MKFVFLIMDSLQTITEDRSRNWKAVINIPYDNSNINWNGLTAIAQFYTYILHNRDTKLDENNNVVLKTPHYHLVFVTFSRRRFNAVLNNLALVLGVPLNCVSLEKSDDIQLDIAYMIHRFNPNKFQYDSSLMVTNNETWLLKNSGSLTQLELDYMVIDETNSCNGDYVSLAKLLGCAVMKEYKDVIYGIFKSNKWW